MILKGWFRVHRKIWGDHPILEGDPFSRREAWLYLVGEAAFDVHRRRSGAEIVTLKRGELIVSVRGLGKVFGWGKSKVSTFLRHLVEAKMLKDTSADRNRTPLGTVYRVVNYDTYNPVENSGADSNRDRRPDSNGYANRDADRDTLEEVKNVLTTSVDKSTGASPVVDNSENEKSEQMTWSDFAGWFRTKGHMILWSGPTPPRGTKDTWTIANDLSIAKRIHSRGVSLELIRGVIEAGVWSEKFQGFEANRGITMAWYADKADPERWGIAVGKYEIRQSPAGNKSRRSGFQKLEVELGRTA